MDQVPGKEEFHETIRYFKSELADSGVKVVMGHRADATSLIDENVDKVILATGVKPRYVSPGSD